VLGICKIFNNFKILHIWKYSRKIADIEEFQFAAIFLPEILIK